MDPEFFGSAIYLLYTLIFFLAIVMRYFVAAGVFYGYYFIWRSEKFSTRRLSRRKLRKGQLRKEIIWSGPRWEPWFNSEEGAKEVKSQFTLQ